MYACVTSIWHVEARDATLPPTGPRVVPTAKTSPVMRFFIRRWASFPFLRLDEEKRGDFVW